MKRRAGIVLFLTACASCNILMRATLGDNDAYHVHTVFIKAPTSVLTETGIQPLLDVSHVRESEKRLLAPTLTAIVDDSKLFRLFLAEHVSIQKLPSMTVCVGHEKEVNDQVRFWFPSEGTTGPTELNRYCVGPKVSVRLEKVDTDFAEVTLSYENRTLINMPTNADYSAFPIRGPGICVVSNTVCDKHLPLNRWLLVTGVGVVNDGEFWDTQMLFGIRISKPVVKGDVLKAPIKSVEDRE